MAGSRTLDRLIDKFARHSVLSEDDREALRALPARPRSLGPHETLIREGEPPTFCAALVDGFADREKAAAGNRRQIVAVHVPGDALDLQNLYLDVSDHSVRTLTRAEVVTISREHLQRLADERPAIARAITRDTLIEASILREWMLNLGRRDARARIAHLLCEFAVRMDAAGLGASRVYTLPMSQEQLGDALGLTPVHVNRTLRALETDGLIARERRSVVFPDWRRLSAVAEFEPRYLHLGILSAREDAAEAPLVA